MIINTAITLATAAGLAAAIATALVAHVEAARRTVVVKYRPIISRARCRSLGLRRM
jgi:UDP-N-acetylglucosamine 2-epimerase